MKKSILVAAVCIVVVGTGGAGAADLSVKAPPIVAPPIFNWTGFYIGGNVGGHWGNDRITTTTDPGLGFGPAGAAAIDAASPTTLHPQGVIGGVQGGYNWQFGGGLFGVEADADWLGGTASRTLGPGIPVINSADTMFNSSQGKFLATGRARLGAVFDRALLYVTGGVAVGTVNTTDTMGHFGNTIFETTSNSTTRTGWTAGGGLEYAFGDSWSGKIEYLHVGLGNFDTFIPPSSGNADDITVHHHYTDNIVRVGLNYRFGYSPAVARY